MVFWALLCHSCGFACQQRFLKTFPGPGYLRSEDGVVWLWHWLVNLYIWLTISSCYDSIPLALGLIGRDGGLSTLCHSCRFACQQRVLKMFPGPGYLHPKIGWQFDISTKTLKYIIPFFTYWYSPDKMNKKWKEYIPSTFGRVLNILSQKENPKIFWQIHIFIF